MNSLIFWQVFVSACCGGFIREFFEFKNAFDSADRSKREQKKDIAYICFSLASIPVSGMIVIFMFQSSYLPFLSNFSCDAGWYVRGVYC